MSRGRESKRQCHLEPKLGIEYPRSIVWLRRSDVIHDQILIREIDEDKSSCDFFKTDGNFNTLEGTNNQTNPNYHTIWFSNTACFGDVSVKHDDVPVKTLMFHILIGPKLPFEDDGHAGVFFEKSNQPIGLNWCRIFDRYDDLQPNVQHYKRQTSRTCNKTNFKVTNERPISISSKWLSTFCKLPLSLGWKRGV